MENSKETSYHLWITHVIRLQLNTHCDGLIGYFCTRSGAAQVIVIPLIRHQNKHWKILTVHLTCILSVHEILLNYKWACLNEHLEIKKMDWVLDFSKGRCVKNRKTWRTADIKKMHVNYWRFTVLFPKCKNADLTCCIMAEINNGNWLHIGSFLHNIVHQPFTRAKDCSSSIFPTRGCFSVWSGISIYWEQD